jgi:hypothetical protein
MSETTEHRIGVIETGVNIANDVNAVFGVANASTGIAVANATLHAQAAAFSTAVPFFNLGLQALQWGLQAYQETTIGCSEKTFVFCHRPESAADTVSTWPAYMPSTIALDTLVYLELVAERVTPEQWAHYLQESKKIVCLKSVMRKIQWDCNVERTSLMTQAQKGNLTAYKNYVWHCGQKASSIPDHHMNYCKGINYLKPSMCDGMDQTVAKGMNVKECGMCNGRLQHIPPRDIPSANRELSDCELDALKMELLAITEGTSNFGADNTNFDADHEPPTDQSAKQTERIAKKWERLELWINLQSNREHLDALHGCMKMNSLSDSTDGPYFEKCFRKMCNIPVDAEVPDGQGVDESNWWSKVHQVGNIGVRSSSWKSALNAKCSSIER